MQFIVGALNQLDLFSSEILKSLKRLAKQYFDMVGADIIVFEK